VRYILSLVCLIAAAACSANNSKTTTEDSEDPADDELVGSVHQALNCGVYQKMATSGQCTALGSGVDGKSDYCYNYRQPVWDLDGEPEPGWNPCTTASQGGVYCAPTDERLDSPTTGCTAKCRVPTVATGANETCNDIGPSLCDTRHTGGTDAFNHDCLYHTLDGLCHETGVCYHAE
jgi:hypothetical protein